MYNSILEKKYHGNFWSFCESFHRVRITSKFKQNEMTVNWDIIFQLMNALE